MNNDLNLVNDSNEVIGERTFFIKEVVTAIFLKKYYVVPTLLLKPTVDCLDAPHVNLLDASVLEKIDDEIIKALEVKQTLTKKEEKTFVVYHNDGNSIFMVQFFPTEEVKTFFERYQSGGFDMTVCETDGPHLGLYLLQPSTSNLLNSFKQN